jgi:hypothetical protein
MKLLPAVLVSVLTAAPTLALAQDDARYDPYDDPATAAALEPQAPPPAVLPPAPSQQYQAAPSGQWVYTQQYGWLWMPYGAQYASDRGVNDPYLYCYGPTYGWRWLAAPWVVGWGVSPSFGAYGPGRFAWYRPGPGHRGWAQGRVYGGGFRDRGHFGGYGDRGFGDRGRFGSSGDRGFGDRGHFGGRGFGDRGHFGDRGFGDRGHFGGGGPGTQHGGGHRR